MSTVLEQIAGGHRGQKYISSSITGQKFHTIIVHDDAVIDLLTDTAGVNLVTDYNISGVTLRAGTVITTKGNPIASAGVASGSLMGYSE